MAGFITAKSNCSIQSYVPALSCLMDFGVKDILACTYQAISGAGKNFATWPEMVDNLIPYIGGEEEKSEQEPLKIWGKVEDGKIIHAASPRISAQCYRVPVSDGHTAAVYVNFDRKPAREEIIARWQEWTPLPQQLKLPSAPQQPIILRHEENRPQPRRDRDNDKGMAVTIGRLRPCPVFDIRFVALSHNTKRGAALGGILNAELLKAQGFFDNL